LQNFAGQFPVVLQRIQVVARGVTFVAVAERGSEIGAAIPRFGFALHGPEAFLA
jgi:hypothetical protein